jgi:hypothetical protein
MPNGLMQLLAYGAEDLYLTGNPSFTYWKMIYKRYTNFAMEYITQYFTGTFSVSTTQNTIISCKIDRNADLLYDMYLVFDLPDIYTNINEPFAWVKNFGQNLIYSAEITFNGVRADIQYGIWMNIWNELTLADDLKPAYDRLIGNMPYFHQTVITSSSDQTNLAIPKTRLHIPLNFWFCRNSGLAIPLIALQSTFIYINIELNPLNNLFVIGSPLIAPKLLFDPDYINSPNVSPINRQIYENVINNGFGIDTLLSRYTYNLVGQSVNPLSLGTPIPNQQLYLDVNFIYLDDEERRRFAQIEHEYLITEVQQRVYPGIEQGPNVIDFSDIQHPTKELIWILQREDVMDTNSWNDYTIDPRSEDFYRIVELLNTRYQEPTLQSLNKYLPTDPNIQNFFLNYLTDNNMLITQPQNTFTNYQNIANSFEIIFNGNRRMEIKTDIFFNYLQPYKYHSHTGKQGIYVFSFALSPEKDHPSGTCNFSRIQKSQMAMSIHQILDSRRKYNLFLYAISYNILRITGGIASTVFTY